MLLFGRGKALKNIEDGLRWKAAGTALIPGQWMTAPEGVIAEVPELGGKEQQNQFIAALAAESGYLVGQARPGWVHLAGTGVSLLPLNRVRAVAEAACPGARSIGMDLNPARLEPGAIAGFRSIGVDRFNFRLDGPFGGIDEPVRRAKALGASAFVEICFGGELSGRAFLQAVERAVAASASQISLSDERSRGAFGAEFLERAGEMCAVAGYRRVNMWTWAQSLNCYDSLGIRLSGRCVNLGPKAFNCRPTAYSNPGLQRWLDTRLAGVFEADCADGRLDQWLALAAGLYSLELRRDALDCKMHRHLSALQRMGVVDRHGKPAGGPSMEFCHRAARAARMVMLTGPDGPEPVADSLAEALLPARKRG